MVFRWIFISVFDLMWHAASWKLHCTLIREWEWERNKGPCYKKQFDFADILNKFHPQTTLLRTASVEVVMGIIYKMLWGAQWPDGSGVGGGGSEGLVGQILIMMHLYTIVYTAHLVYIILEVVDFKQRLNQEKNILNAWRINKECELLDRNPPSTCTRRKNDSYEQNHCVITLMVSPVLLGFDYYTT